MSNYIISGIQQVGVGIPNVQEAFKWYRKNLGMDIKVFEEAAEANLMLPYTGGKPHQRHAILAINGNGGGGIEIWQYTSREPQLPNFEIQTGDLGLFVCKIKSRNVMATYEFLKARNTDVIDFVTKDPKDELTFFVKDPFGNIFQIVSSNNWFGKTKYTTGGPYGCIIGVSDVEKSKEFYSKILGYDTVVYDKTGQFEDLKGLNAGDQNYRRVLLQHSKKRAGAFSPMLGDSEIELIQALDRKPQKIFENRFWGDRGFIHLCYDINGMENLREYCKANNCAFTVDSAKADQFKDTFDMGEAAGHFSYVEDPDGALIEFVETHKVPIAKKWNWYLNLKKRNPNKALPKWMLKAMALNRVKD